MKHTKTFTLTSDLLTLYSTESNTASKTEIANGASFTVGSGRMALAGISLPEETLPPPLAGTHEGFPRSAVLVSAILSLYGTASDVENDSKLMLFSPCFDDAGTLLPATESLTLDYEPLENEVGAKYSFDITAALRSLQYNATAKAFMLSVVGNGTVLLEGVGTANAPTLTLTYETSYGNKTFGETKTYPLTPCVHATVDLLRGNLMYSIDDFTIGKGGIPYVVRHAYNSAMSMKLFTKNHGIDTAHFSPMRLGYGWRMNLFRSMVKIDDYYVYTDDNGNEHPLHARYNGMYGNEALLYSPSENTLSCTSFSCKFDERGRMIELYDGKGKKILCLEYNEHRIAKLTDSCGKEYHFTYSEYGYLERIYTDNIDDPIVRFGCRNGFLTYVWHGEELAVMEYEDGDKDLNLTPENACTVAYRDCSGCNVKMTTFSFEGERVKSVTISKDENGVVTTDTETYTAEEGKGNEFSEKENLLDSIDSGESAWHGTGDCTIASDGTISLMGSPSAPCFAYREIATPADASTRDDYILFASAKANSLPDRKRSDGHRSVFGIRAEIVYADGETEAYRKSFSALTNDWQHAALHFSKRKYKAVEKLRIFCDYSNQANTACFGDLTLVCEGKSVSTPFDMGARTVILQAGTRDEDFIDYQSRGECNCDDGADYIHVCYNNRASRRTRIIVSKNALPLPHDSRIIDAKLILYPAKIGTFGTIKGYNSLEIDYVGKPVEISLSDPFKNSDEVSIWLQHASEEVNASFYKTGEYAPLLIIRYISDSKPLIPSRTVSLTDTVRAKLDVENGKLYPLLPLLSDSTVPFFAVHTKNAICTELGAHFCHNFCETFLGGSGDIPYTYTDACGIAHPIKERFYYSPAPGVYEFVEKEDVTVHPDGRLFYGNESVVRELYTETGWLAKVTSEDIKGSDLLEERTEELANAEEQLYEHRKALDEFEVVGEADGEVLKNGFAKNYAGYCDFLSKAQEDGHLLLTKSEAINYRSVLLSLDELENQKDLNENQSEALEYQQESLALYEESVVQQMNAAQLRMRMLAYENLSDSDDKGYVLADCSRCHVSATCHSDCESYAHTIDTDSYRQPCQFSKEFEGLSAEEKEKLQAIQFAECQIKQEKAQKALLCKELINNKKQQANMDNQPNLYKTTLELLKARKLALNEQIAEYKHISALHIEQLKKLTKGYFALSEQVARIKKMLPVRYLVKDGTTKCFNAAGELCMISYNSGRTLCAERDSENRIVRLVDEKNRPYRLSYTDGLLCEIVTPNGERTVAEYAGGDLRSIILDAGDSLSLAYDEEGNLSEIASTRDRMRARMYYNNGRLRHLARYSDASRIANGICEGAPTLVSELSVQYKSIDITLCVNGYATEQYLISKSAVEHRSITNDCVIAAERQERRSQKEEITVKAERGCLGEPLSSFEFKDGECITHTKNALGNLISEVSNWFPFCKGKDENSNDVTAMRRFARTYSYDAEGRAVTARTEVSEKLNDNTVNTHTEVQSFAYNADGAIVRKESYIEGEEYTNGKSIEETLYDKHGNALRTVSYNTLDPSSKQYTELERDEGGRILSAFDATGLHKVSYEYKDSGSDTVITEVKPNGARLSFGNTRSGHTAITLSTEAGEENSNTVRRTAGLVTELESGGRKINYRYDGKRRISAVELDGKPYIAYTYQDNVNENGRTVDHTVATLSDGTRMRSVYDKCGNLLRAERNGAVVLRATYDAFGKPATHYDAIADTEATYDYDFFDRITSYKRTKNDAPLLSETYEYDGFGKLVTRRVTFDTKEIETEYAYHKDAKKKLDRVKVNGLTVRPVYDALGRTVGRVVESENENVKIAGEQVSYRKVGDHTTNVPAAIRFARRKECGYTTDGCLQYRYDAMGNIIEIREDGKLLAHYTYDAVGRITREDNRKLGKTTLFTYDNRGNILSREVAAYTASDVSTDELDGERTLYEYEGEHLVRCGDEVFVYDAIGNPTTYRGKAASFANGRQMVALDGNTFTYDGSGRRMTKNGISFLYDSHGNLISESDGLTFLYDHAGLCGVVYGENTYIYRKDAQGNIITLLDNNGNIVVKYTYDAWGNHTVEDNTDCNLGTLNPFRYRGYYYDAETGLYYLQTRYYDPEIGRFVTVDDVAYLAPDTVGGLNLYAYCNNNPVMCVDPSGTEWEAWENFKKSISSIFGYAVVRTHVSYFGKKIREFFFFQIESGKKKQENDVVKGSLDNPITFFYTFSSESNGTAKPTWGLKLSFGDFTASTSLSLGNISNTISFKKTSVTFSLGFGRTELTISREKSFLGESYEEYHTLSLRNFRVLALAFAVWAVTVAPPIGLAPFAIIF